MRRDRATHPARNAERSGDSHYNFGSSQGPLHRHIPPQPVLDIHRKRKAHAWTKGADFA